MLQDQNVGSLLIAELVTALYCVGSLKQSRNRVAIVEVRTVTKATSCTNKMHYLPLFRSGLEIRPAVSEANCRERNASSVIRVFRNSQCVTHEYAVKQSA